MAQGHIINWRAVELGFELKTFILLLRGSAKLCLLLPTLPPSHTHIHFITILFACKHFQPLTSGTSSPFPPGFCCPITTHVYIDLVPVQGGIGVGGRARCKGTGSSLFGSGSPACCQQALWPAPTPPFWPQAQAGFLTLVPCQQQTTVRELKKQVSPV